MQVRYEQTLLSTWAGFQGYWLERQVMCAEPDHNHTIDWAYQNQLRQQWIINNPDAEYEGWMSI